jgi:FKBP-type peptidyl-prolyl cis-trans isomerase
MSLFEKLSKAKEDKASANLQAGQDYLAENKTKPGIVETASGLQYEVLALGEGVKPTAAQSVTCHYHGMLIDGTVFDSSVNRGKPATFPLNQVYQRVDRRLAVYATWKQVPVFYSATFRIWQPPGWTNDCAKQYIDL